MNAFKLIKISLIIAAGITISACSGKTRETNVLSVSITPQKFFVDALTDGAIDVNVMIPPGASHATYSPTPQQFRKLSDSRIYIGIGHLGYEQAWMPRLKELNPDMKLLDLSEKTVLISGSCNHDHHDHDHHHNGVDPHIWMSPRVMLELLPHIKNALTENFPELREIIESNYPALYTKIETLDTRMYEASRDLAHKQFLIFHPALTYLARDYGLEQIAIEQDGKEPSPAFLASVIRKAREEKIPVIFIQEEYDIRNAEMVSREAGIALVQINPLAYDWIQNMETLIETIKVHLNE
ncbi:metal ABC transporter solute-binding protein, Zn/Mn family [Alkaliflexus imshenetskii]|uniref:metal ABC transporter solute-binding protein, Zn/Mn family n=1 Tax=Alkaliflexus imshenetskii TaxID=286730 RepID=UPI00047CC987|nr:zinc ABC transporter substrate-binding protein [Alkaliflexus imshenetskii]